MANKIKYLDPVNTNLLLDDWEIKFNDHLLKFKNQSQVENWIIRRLEVFLGNPYSLTNLSLLDSLFILPPLQDHFNSIMLCLEKEDKGGIMGPKGFGKKFFVNFLSHFWSLKYETPILFIENINLLVKDDWEAIQAALISLTNAIDPKKKLLLILHNSDVISIDLERQINRLVNLAINTPLSLFYLHDYIEIEDYNTHHNKTFSKLQSLLRVSKKECILIFDNNNEMWISYYKIWLVLIFKNFFGINIKPLMNNIDDQLSLFDFQERLNLSQILNIYLLSEKGSYDKIISEIKINEENVVLHSFLIESLFLIYEIDQAVEYLDEYKQIYEKSQSLAKWYLLYGKSLSMRGLTKEAKDSFNEALKHAEFSDRQEIKNEIAQWIGNSDNK
ncbi:MAG: hypothetical protein HeimC3_31140 [Candidatus Heimdallarchaeota archaeon LC_3]|nr:MAG: hypothetical protein HeimC3_31140 [Candidatus Heimdallarchaeota archaeon LC_3]